MAYENVGLVWTAESLRSHLATITRPAWCNAITLHHTGSPTLSDRPIGFTAQHLLNLRHYYKVKLGWSAGPHLFIDDDQIWGMGDFRKKGVHAVSFNSRSIGIEVLGHYDYESARTGRGLECWKTAAAATSVLLDWLELEPNETTVLFHREDPETSKTCPGNKVKKDWILELIRKDPAPPPSTSYPKPELDVVLRPSEWKFAGEQWNVPVAAYLAKKGVSSQTLRENLTKDGTKFYYQGEWLEGAFYDLQSESTWAPVRELTDLKIG